jgi:hypothetical protein
MNRRHFGLLAASSLGAISAGMGMPGRAKAAVSADKAALLKTTLTPFGAEKAGNADGTIPAWTGGLTTLPPGAVLGGPNGLMPDFFASDEKIVSINAQNMAQYQDKLTPGVMAMMTKFPDFRIDVYPTHRTATGPQWVYDFTYQNALNAQANPGGARLGFSNAYGGPPFPIPDETDPLEAGAQIMWNHNSRWQSSNYTRTIASYVVSHGVLTLASGYYNRETSPYYQPDGSIATYNGFIRQFQIDFIAPPNINGQQLVELQPTDSTKSPTLVWQYLNGQGRVRKAPELTYDTPASSAADIGNYDEYFVFYGALDRYDWKLIGKKEIYVPYNNNKMMLSTAENAHLQHFLNPDVVRWELHRCWVVDATLHPGDRNVLPHRRYYVDEDTWHAMLGDTYDANGNMYKVPMIFMENRPDVPSTFYGNSVVYNLQTDEYVTLGGAWNEAPYNGPLVLTKPHDNVFNPQTLGASAAY